MKLFAPERNEIFHEKVSRFYLKDKSTAGYQSLVKIRFHFSRFQSSNLVSFIDDERYFLRFLALFVRLIYLTWKIRKLINTYS